MTDGRRDNNQNEAELRSQQNAAAEPAEGAAAQPDTGQPSTGQPSTGQSDAAQPESAEPAASRSAAEAPDAAPQEASGPDAAEQAAAAEVVEDDLDELRRALAERDEFKDLALRAKADFENYRKRADKRVAETRGVAVASVLSELLPVVDNLDRAITVDTSTDGGRALAEGVRLVHADLHAVLDRLGLTPIDPAGEAFDPNFHEAISQAPAAEGVAAGTIVEVVQKGFKLGEVVVRPARVVVAQ